MTEDNLYLLICYLVYGLTLLILTLKSKNRTKTLVINLTILFIYSGFLLYNLKYNSSGGSGLVWLIYLMIALGLHWITNLISLINKLLRKAI
jgi:ABC-type Co2+ transport system permease subunit